MCLWRTAVVLRGAGLAGYRASWADRSVCGEHARRRDAHFCTAQCACWGWALGSPYSRRCDQVVIAGPRSDHWTLRSLRNRRNDVSLLRFRKLLQSREVVAICAFLIDTIMMI